jgi:hypothetical protein
LVPDTVSYADVFFIVAGPPRAEARDSIRCLGPKRPLRVTARRNRTFTAIAPDHLFSAARKQTLQTRDHISQVERGNGLMKEVRFTRW